MLIYDLADPQELLGFVRNIPLPRYTLSAWLPNQQIDDIEFRFNQGDFSEQDAATYRGFDAEAPLGTRPGVKRVSGELPPISKKMVLGEEARMRLRQLQGQQGVNQQLIDQVFDDAGNLARSVQARIELARGDALFTGKVTIEENGVSAVADYGYDASQFVTANALWSNVAGDVIDELTAWTEAYQERTSGELPGAILTSRKARNNLLKNQQIAALAATLAGAPQRVTTSTLNAVLADYDLPPIVTYDTQVKIGGVKTRVTPENQAALLPVTGANVLGRTFWGVTAEAIELAEARQIDTAQAPGMVAVVDKKFDPVATWTKVAGISIPAIANPELVTVATVL